MQVIQKIKQFLLHRSLKSGSSDPGSGNRLRCSRNTYIKNQRNIRIIGSVSLVLLFTLTAFTLRPVSVSSDFAEATVNPSTTTLTVATSGNAAILDITPSSTSGTFATSDASDTSLEFSVTTDNITGYNLSIRHASATSPAPLVNEALSLNLDSLETSVTESQFNTSTYVGRYGYRPSMLNSEDNSNYIPAPTVTATTLNVTSQANTADTSDDYTIALGANIDYTKSAGTYTNTFILTAVANNVAYTIKYLDNTGDTSIGDSLPETESASVTGASSFTLSSTIPTRTGYTFAGWCDGTVAHNATGNDTCSGTTYPAGSSYSFASPSSTSTNVANLYAMWNVKTFAITLDKTNATAIVIDDTSYTSSSATLTYGNHTISGTYPSGYEFSSWATSNSTNLAITSTTSASTTITVHGAATLTLTGKTSKLYIQDFTATMCKNQASSSAVTVYDKRDEQAYTVRYINGNCWMTKNLAIGCNGDTISSKSLTSADSNVGSTWSTPTLSLYIQDGTSGCNYSDGSSNCDSYYPRMKCSSDHGAWYNYAAASAGTITGSSNQNTQTYDICPKGWKLPTLDQFSGITSSSSAFSPVFSLSVNGGYIHANRNGFWWSATAYDAASRYYLYWNGFSLFTDNSNLRSYGYSVRCVLKDTRTISDITYMQDVNPDIVANTAEGATATLIDKRDNQSYLVGKLADGKLWMLDNLRLGSADFAVNTLDSTNTNTTNSIATGTFAGWNKTSDFLSSNTPMINTASANKTTTGYGSGSKKIGVYYNYCAATMQSYCMAQDSGSGNASQDVCPKGWRMPTGGSNGEYQALYTAYSSNATNFRNALSTPLSGVFHSSSAGGQGSDGTFWSSTYLNGNLMYNLNVNWSDVYPLSSGNRLVGFSVRCVLK